MGTPWFHGSMAAAEEQPDPIAACVARVAASPDAYEAYRCFVSEGRGALEDEASSRLEEIRRQRPEVGWPLLTLGQLAIFSSGREVEALEFFDAAVERFMAAGEPLGEILARQNRHILYIRHGRFAEAAEEVEAARRAAVGSEDPEVRTRALVLAGAHRHRTGGDLVTVLADFRRAEDTVFPNGSFGLKRSVLLRLGRVAFELGNYDEALEAYGRFDELIRSEGETVDLPLAAFNLANTRQAQLENDPREDGLVELRDRMEAVLEQADSSSEAAISLRCRAVLAQIYAPTAPQRARQHVTRCLRQAAELERPDLAIPCLWSRAYLEIQQSPAAALATTAEALAAADSVDNDELRAYGWRVRMRAAWAALPRAEALAEGLMALETIETLRDGQRDADDRAHVLENWTTDYSWLAGRLLASEQDPAAAFAIFERLRGRVLLETIHRPKVVANPEQLAAVKRRAVELQRKLLDPALPEAERSTARTALEREELEERVLRAETPAEVNAEVTGEALEAEVPSLISLERLRAALRPREALLTFQVDHRVDLFGVPAGDSWVLAITRETVRVHRLPDRRRIVAATQVLRGLVDRRNGFETEGAADFGRQLLGDVVAALPSTVERLILVPDGILHHLPFALLRPTVDGLPLGVRYELVVTPSATLWSNWRAAIESMAEPAAETSRRQVSALVLADPTFPHSRGDADERGGAWVDGLRLGRLPEARREGRAIRRHLGGELLLGAVASERRLKSESLSRYAVLHFATHAIADLRRPERSCLLLAPGGEEEDGLLRVSEVVDLNLRGNMVVLSACHTSHGEVLRGEGLMSLARAFFAAGAGSVVGSHWPLADAEAADFFDAFYRHLAAGESAAGALRSARREGYEAGNPAQAWAGPVLLGSGDPRIAVQRRSTALVAGLVGGMFLLGVAIWVWRRRSRP